MQWIRRGFSCLWYLIDRLIKVKASLIKARLLPPTHAVIREAAWTHRWNKKLSYLQAPGNVLWLTASAGWVFRSELDNCTMSRVPGIFLFCWRRNTYYWEGRIIFLSSISIFLWKTPSISLITLTVQMFNAFLVRMSTICWWFSPVVSCFLIPFPPVHKKKPKRFDYFLWGMAKQLRETVHFNIKVTEGPKSPRTPNVTGGAVTHPSSFLLSLRRGGALISSP